MREAHRPQITGLFKKHHSCLSDNAQNFKGTVVLDGGSILYTINWRKGNTFETLAGQYTKFVQKMTCSRSVKSRRSLTYILKSQLLKTQRICTGHRELVPRLG